MIGLMYFSAAINVADQMRQAAGYVDRILKGTPTTATLLHQTRTSALARF
jgi:hypothetical protein